MSFNEVKTLRKSGKLDEALIMAKQDLQDDPSNIWNKRSIAWVYYDYLKLYAEENNIEHFIDCLSKIKTLELSDNETMFFDNSAWIIGKLIFDLINNQTNNDETNRVIDLIFDKIKKFHFTKPSEAYSFLYKAFHKCYKTWDYYILFADWWDFQNFRAEDYLKEEFKDKKIMSIAEQAYIAYSKKLLEGEAEEVNGFLLPKSINKPKINKFLPKLDTIIEEYPEYQYPPYFKAKLLLALGDEKEVLSSFLPFAKKKRNDFWVWELLADTYSVEDERKLACLCKALSLKTSNDFLINTRQKLAEILINKNKFSEAKTEIENILSTRNDNNWKTPQQILKWTKQPWYQDTPLSKKDNSTFYKQYIKTAEEILFADIPEETVVVEFVNRHKSIINFIKDKSRHGFFKYSGMIENPNIGDIIKVRFNGNGKDGFYKVLSIRKIQEDISCRTIKEFSGKLKIRETANYGFVDDVFFDSKFIQQNNLTNNQIITGKAFLSYNKKRNEWGWKAIKANIQNSIS